MSKRTEICTECSNSLERVFIERAKESKETTKDWEEDFYEEFYMSDDIPYPNGSRRVKEFIAKHLSREVAKERTQLLARVREEVIGNKPNVGKKDEVDHNFWIKVGRSRQIGEQLTKLEIISEEVKE